MKMRMQKHEIRKFMFWGYNNLSQNWQPYGNLYGYDSPEEAIKSQLIEIDSEGNVLDERNWKDGEWKIVEII